MAELNLSDRFAVELTDTLIDLQRLTGKTAIRVLSMLRLLQDDLTDQIDKLDVGSSRRRRAERLLENVKKIIDRRLGVSQKRLESELMSVASYSSGEAVNVINTLFTVNITGVTLTLSDLRALLDDALVLGLPAKEWWASQSERLRRAYAQQVRLGLLAGETNQQIIKRIRGGTTGRTLMVELADGRMRRVNEFAGGIMQASMSEAARLVRTSVMSVANSAIWETYRANDDIIKAVAALTTLDERTSPICIARTGAVWSLDGEATKDSAISDDFPGPPPWHWYCRTVLMPITYSWEELAEKATGKRRRLLDTVPDSVRASADGLIPTGMVRTFDDWARIRGDAYARAKLGPGRFDLWKQGKITLSQLINSQGKIRTLAELRALVAQAGRSLN